MNRGKEIKTRKVNVEALWDKNAGVWCASSEDVFGLFVEAENLDELAMQLAITFTDLLTFDKEPLPDEVIFRIKCIKEEKGLKDGWFDIRHVPQQAAAAV